jgi:hypothetical protein
VPANGAELWLKLEYRNPTGSMKDRMARAMVDVVPAVVGRTKVTAQDIRNMVDRAAELAYEPGHYASDQFNNPYVILDHRDRLGREIRAPRVAVPSGWDADGRYGLRRGGGCGARLGLVGERPGQLDEARARGVLALPLRAVRA